MRGELYLWWPTFADSVHRQQEAQFLSDPQLRAQGCRTPRRGTQFAACRIRFTHVPDWARVARQLDAFDVWRLPGSDALEALGPRRRARTDQLGVRLERRTGSTYEIGWYYDVDAYEGRAREQLRGLLALLSEAWAW